VCTGGVRPCLDLEVRAGRARSVVLEGHQQPVDGVLAGNVAAGAEPAQRCGGAIINLALIAMINVKLGAHLALSGIFAIF
jgi:hypothetical protein